jgi:hypothetical protein
MSNIGLIRDVFQWPVLLNKAMDHMLQLLSE